ncbi:Fe-S cluster assembly protein SufD [Pinibacter aurantiacus]|uniref:Fe-S cluster assembly protein SufD n=1 Tax=Pinibacter aurantiacus TaxID=2851599 RepID=A0A9E2W6P4_9BACT|nr:Fe-S cluster assembly protein SufD [Pinibacter aurantiacus]MBV4360063.1 Fe-S cluster assembly protein SufD [Pinibacter aurantiacus]
MNMTELFKDQFAQLQAEDKDSKLSAVREQAFSAFNEFGIPTVRHEEWKYTRIGTLFAKDYKSQVSGQPNFSAKDVDAYRLPGHKEANELVFVNGQFADKLSTIRSKDLTVLHLAEAAKNEYSEIVSKHFGHSSDYLKDGINALNTAFVKDGIFIHVKRSKIIEEPVYIYNITDAAAENILAQPRSLIYLSENAQLQIIETFATRGTEDSFTNQIMEVIVEKDARFEYCKIQNDSANASQVSTTHIRQTGTSYVNAIIVSLNGEIVRNNTNVVMEAPHCEAHLYGLYFQKGNSHIDNHTIVDNVMPHCFSNELYKGMMDENSTGVFNGKIFVRQPAQKTNAFQSNKNILLSNNASVNTKPQLEIFADDVKCSHGCTIGQLDEEGLFYLQSRGIPEKIAKSMLLVGFASDILDKINLPHIRTYVDHLVAERLGN